MSDLPLNIVQAVISNARRLGLMWALTPATVDIAASATNAMVPVIVDGDDVVINTTSLIGGLDPGRRVMVLTVPPAGNYIVGYYGDISIRRQLTYLETKRSTLALVLSTTATLVPGVSHTIETTTPNAYFDASGIMDYEVAGGASGICIAQLRVNGVIDPGELLYNNASAGRGTFAQEWSGELTPGTHLFEVLARKTAALGSATAHATHSALKLRIFE